MTDERLAQIQNALIDRYPDIHEFNGGWLKSENIQISFERPVIVFVP